MPDVEDAIGQQLISACRSLPGTTEDVKWEHNLVFSVGAKMFAVFDLPAGSQLSFKVDPDAFDALTRTPGVIPAPYLAKHHWVKLEATETLPYELVEELLAESHAIVAAKLSKRAQRELGLLG